MAQSDGVSPLRPPGGAEATWAGHHTSGEVLIASEEGTCPERFGEGSSKERHHCHVWRDQGRRAAGGEKDPEPRAGQNQTCGGEWPRVGCVSSDQGRMLVPGCGASIAEVLGLCHCGSLEPLETLEQEQCRMQLAAGWRKAGRLCWG